MLFVLAAIVVIGAAAGYIYLQNKKNAEDGDTSEAAEAALEAQIQASHAAYAKAQAPTAGQGQSSSVRKNWLVGVTGEVQGKSYHIGERMVSIGRKPSNFIQINDQDSSRIHCHLKPSPNGMVISDMKSRNGTFVGKTRISAPVELSEGDIVKVGTASFRYHRAGDFDRNDAFERKTADASVNAETSASEGLDSLITRALRDAGGDVEVAAKRLQVPAALVQGFVDRQRR
jgi:hypothetical protein